MDQQGQLFFAFDLRPGIDVAGKPLPVDPWGVSPLPQAVVDLADTPGAWFSPLALVSMEGAGRQRLGRLLPFFLWLGFADTPVDLVCRTLLHGVGDVGITVQRGATGHMADDGAQRFYIHPVFQGGCGECVPEIVEPEALTLRPFQHRLEALPDGGRVHGGVCLHG